MLDHLVLTGLAIVGERLPHHCSALIASFERITKKKRRGPVKGKFGNENNAVIGTYNAIPQ
jgi:hypothetical protein